MLSAQPQEQSREEESTPGLSVEEEIALTLASTFGEGSLVLLQTDACFRSTVHYGGDKVPISSCN